MMHNSSDIKRIKAALKRGQIRRNVKTAVILLVASSGAFVSQPALAITACGTFISLLIASKFQGSQKKESIPDDQHSTPM